MAKEYKVNVGGKEIVYGSLVRGGRLSVEEWDAIAHEMVIQNLPEEYEKYKNNVDVIDYISSFIDMRERYEVLLELLPQSARYVETPAYMIADKVYENTLDKDITKDDIKMFIDESKSLDELKLQLTDYFDLDSK
ncbi:hypothetical protein [Pseudolactococcus laudensis]|uniref:hypothetical protein n=1 Tax=Pseudolactococcus laudensis TaxID=1494461 RepID=UPI003F9CF895